METRCQNRGRRRQRRRFMVVRRGNAISRGTNALASAAPVRCFKVSYHQTGDQVAHDPRNHMRTPPNQTSDADWLFFEGRPRMLAQALYSPELGNPERGMRIALATTPHVGSRGRKAVQLMKGLIVITGEPQAEFVSFRDGVVTEDCPIFSFEGVHCLAHDHRVDQQLRFVRGKFQMVGGRTERVEIWRLGADGNPDSDAPWHEFEPAPGLSTEKEIARKARGLKTTTLRFLKPRSD
jgi:hypothetical protein